MDTHTLKPFTAARTLLWETTLWAMACLGGVREIAHRGGLLHIKNKD